MSLETTLKETCASLTSDRATERKKNAENLKSFLTGNAAPALLTANSLKKNGYSWNNVFEDIHEYILKEYDKSHSSKSFDTQGKPLATSLLHMVIAGANKGKAYLRCETLTNSCLLILKDKQMFKAFGDAYLSLLYKYVFTNEHYFGHFSPKVWEELLQVTVSSCTNKHSSLDHYTRMRLVFLVMQRGKDYCRLAVPMRDVLPMLQKLYLSTITDKKVQEVLIDILNVLLGVLTVEYRFTLCEFVETIMPSLLKYYDQNTENKKKMELFRALALIVELHHPDGRFYFEKGVYAHDWPTWNKQRHSLLELVASECNYLERESTSKFRQKGDKDYADFYVLSALVYKQHFSDVKENEEPTAAEASDSKRQRVTLNKIRDFTDLITEMTRNHCPWFGIITAYFNNAEDIRALRDPHHTLLTNAIEKHISTYKEKSSWTMIAEVWKELIDTTEDNFDSFDAIWNGCVRQSVAADETSGPVHVILQNFINERHVRHDGQRPLIKLYTEGAMPVTNNTVQTLKCIVTTCFTTLSVSEKTSFLKWLLDKQITVEPHMLSSLFLQLIAKENMHVPKDAKSDYCSWGEMVFNSNSDCLLFTAFIKDRERIIGLDREDELTVQKFDVNKQMYDELNKIIITKMMDLLTNMKGGCTLTLLKKSINFLNIVIEYCNDLLTNLADDSLKDSELFKTLYKVFFMSFLYLNRDLTNERAIEDYVPVLKVVKNILRKNYNESMSKDIRSWIKSEFFKVLHNIINRKSNTNLDDDTDVHEQSPKHACILLLAAYCKVSTEYTREILAFILEPALYDFDCPLDVDCAFQCMEILTDQDIAQPPIDLIFTILQSMCKTLFRNPEASRRILKLLHLIMDKLWELPSTATRENCYIIIKVYMDRCEKSFYPSNVAVLVYDCIAKIHSLNQKHKIFSDTNYGDALLSAAKCETHTIRLYCSYLLEDVFNKYSHRDVAQFVKDALDLFTVTVPSGNKTILKDEFFNRTASYLHLMKAVALAKNNCIKLIIMSIITVQMTKSLNKEIVIQVLGSIFLIESYSRVIADYWSKDILGLLHFWYTSGYKTEDLPSYLVHGKNIDKFLEDHMTWIIPAETLWSMGGDIELSGVLQKYSAVENNDKESVVEQCFCKILILCLPYIVIEKYNIHLQDVTTQPTFVRTSQSAKKMFQIMRNIFGNEKWNKLFIDNMGEMLLLTASHLRDYKECKRTFNLKEEEIVEDFYYSESVYVAILKYFAELTGKDIMHFLCEHQPMGISKILVKLWEQVLSYRRLEPKCIALYTYIKFIESVPLGYPSDAFIATYACQTLLNGIEKTDCKEKFKSYAIALKLVISRFITLKADILKDVLPNVILVVMTKKDGERVEECKDLLDYLLAETDQTDGIAALSQNSSKTSRSKSAKDFCETLKSYLSSLSRPSFDILNNLKQFLTVNKSYIVKMWNNLNLKGFSEECKISLLHKLTNALITTIDSGSKTGERLVPADKLIIEATNCLSILGTYDLKTLVMLPPMDSKLISDLKPPQYFAIRIIEWLSKLLLHRNTEVVSSVMVTLTHMLKYREGKNALDLGEVNVNIMKPFQPVNSNYVQARFNLNDSPETRQPHIWLLKQMESDVQWVQRMVTIYLNEITSDFTLNLLEVCDKVLINVSPKILPPIIGLVLYIRQDSLFDKMTEQINHFLEVLWTETYSNSSSYNSQVQANLSKVSVSHSKQKVIQSVIEVIDFIRLQKNNYTHSSEEIETYNYLKLNYGKVAWAATVSGDHFAGLYYGELWAMAENKGIPPKSPEETIMLSDGEHLQSIFRRCYSSIGETDAIEGCGSGHLLNEDEKRKHLINTGQYSDALLVHDVAMSYDDGAGNNDQLKLGVVQALYKSGMHHLALQYMKTLPEDQVPMNVKYDCLSMLGDWSVFVNTQELTRTPLDFNIDITSQLKELRYACLKDCLTLEPSAHEKLELILATAKKTVTKLCQKLNMDNCQNVYSVVSHLQLFSDIESYFAVRCSESSMKDLLDTWKVDKMAPYQDFKHIEPLLSQRSLLLDHAAKTFEFFKKDVMNLQLSYCELALSNKQVQLSQRLLAVAKKCHTAAEVSLVEGLISWEKGHKDISLALVRDVMYNDGQDALLSATAFRQYGTWMSETRMENARDIIDKYLMKSLDALNTDNRNDIRLKVYCDIAKYADAEYKQVVSYMKSSIFENKVKCLETMKGAASSLRSTQQTLSKDEKKALFTNEKLSVLDEADINSTISEKRRFLETAMRFYLLSLQQGETNNLAVFRVTSLWLDNPQFEFERIEDNFLALLQGVPSRKFVAVLPQLAPRLTVAEEPFAKKLNDIMLRCAKEHPFHTLPVLLGLKNSDQDKTIMNASASISTPKGRTSIGGKDEARIAAAKALLLEVMKDEKYLPILKQMNKMCDALISFANFVSKSRDTKQEVPRSEPLYSLGTLPNIPIPTVTLPVRADCNYTDVPGIQSFMNTFELVGGVNCPKKILCLGTDGIRRTTLIKGEDDLRQDAVMQQVFTIVNTLLELDPVTSKNRLSIRTYKVVALSRRSGVLEWCEGTVPVGTYLVGNSQVVGAHRKYRPKDISCQAARAKLQTYHERGRSSAEKLAAYLRILRELKPVFHYFFTEHYLDPVSWYERRLAYTKSVATSSMIGYIMGLGDRHVQNILIDKKTAEVVHIDFGIAFDQGKALPTPETIPFRLTQDVIAGFGANGVEGVFRRSCEKTLQLLRDNHEALLTILEVLLCDPLYTWTITPAEAKRKQNLTATPRDTNNASSSTSGLAERALLAVASKLNGTEGGATSGVAVSGQVARLIRCATDPANLCRLFPGWQPYL